MTVSINCQNILDVDVKMSTDYAIKGMLHLGEVVTIYGQSNVGKSLVVLEILQHICKGQGLGNLKARKGSIVYLAAEAPTSIMRRAMALGLTRQDGSFFVGEGSIDLLDAASIAQTIKYLKALDLSEKLRVVVFDTFSLSIPDADENSATAMSQAISNAKRIALDLDVCVILVHHEGKDDSRGPRGSTAIKGGVDAELKLERSDEIVQLVGTKMRDGLLNERMDFKIDGQDMGVDDDGDPVTVGRAKFVGLSHTHTLPKSSSRKADSIQTSRAVAVDTAVKAVQKMCGPNHAIDTDVIIGFLPLAPFEGLKADSLKKIVRELIKKRTGNLNFEPSVELISGRD
ncbi:MAG: hypothetical protein Q27BPR15_17015 [Rhodobacter sp. CACIA14H1]|nr:MAG: hypothetical protein Q27BPR15_17015 [Rhodobacter sp. CACIA14H1]